MTQATKQQISAISAALKKHTSIASASAVFAAVDDDAAIAHDALWTLVRTGKFALAKNWSLARPLEDSPGRVAWADFVALLQALPPELVAPGGGKRGYGPFFLGNPTLQQPDVPRALASLATRAAADDRAAAGAFDSATLTGPLRLVVEYGQGSVGLPLDAEARVRVLQGLARVIATQGLVTDAWLFNGSVVEHVEFSDAAAPSDAYRLAAPFGSQDQWHGAVAAALIEECRRKETDRYGFRGIPYLHCAEPALRLLSPEDLVLVLGIGMANLEQRPWAQIAKDALAQLSAEQRQRALNALDAQDGTGAHFNDSRTRELLSAL